VNFVVVHKITWGDVVFYDKFMYLCTKKGVAPSRAAVEAGISKSLVTKWKTNGTEVPSPEVLKKLSVFFGVTPDYLLGYDIQSQIDTLSQQISQLKKEIRTASAVRKEELEATLFVLEESYDDLIFAKSCMNKEQENKKISPHKPELTEGEKVMLELFRQIPAEQQPMVLAMIRAALCTDK
jgi:transcriptional regulator with XRE-family HTH domain